MYMYKSCMVVRLGVNPHPILEASGDGSLRIVIHGEPHEEGRPQETMELSLARAHETFTRDKLIVWAMIEMLVRHHGCVCAPILSGVLCVGSYGLVLGSYGLVLRNFGSQILGSCGLLCMVLHIQTDVMCKALRFQTGAGCLALHLAGVRSVHDI